MWEREAGYLKEDPHTSFALQDASFAADGGLAGLSRAWGARIYHCLSDASLSLLLFLSVPDFEASKQREF